ncbi:MAG: hypothetical protein KAI67_06465, partial [Candidatus Pacebacteria bacterium]|nr:hypothetical protein [Candidatus Paceibacterota bacterium]
MSQGRGVLFEQKKETKSGLIPLIPWLSHSSPNLKIKIKTLQKLKIFLPRLAGSRFRSGQATTVK